MAATGNTVTLTSNSYQGRYMKLTCTSTQDVSNNKTNVSWTLESIGGSSGHYATICRVYFSWYVNGTKNETCVYSIDKGYTYNAFPVTKGSTSGSISVPMDSDGNKTIYVDMDVAIYTSSTTRYSVNGGWQLPTVPRYPTISSFSVNKISGSSTSLSFVWSASAPGGNINKLEYSTDNGASFKTASSVTSPLTVGGLASAKGYNCKIRVTSSASGLTATTQTPYYQTTYQQPTANISTANISGYNGLSQIKVNWSSNMTISKVGFSKDNGANYTYFDVNTTSGNYTFTGLAEGQSYNFKVQVKAATGSCVTTSGASSRAPYKRVSGKLFVNGTQVATNNGQTGVALKNGDTLKIDGISNGANCGYKLFFENPDNQHQYLSAKTTGTTAISMTAAQINERLQYFKNDPSQGFNVGLTTLNGSDQPALYYEFFGTISAVNVNPTFDENRWTYQDTNANTVALTGSNQILVNGFSKLRVSVNTAASGNGYATIKQYAVSGCTSGSSSAIGNIDCPNATNGGTIKVTAKDSRNNVTETTKTATFKDYCVPTLTNISATRNNGGVGTQTSLTFNGTWWNGNFGASANTLTAVYRYKSGSTWSEARAITLTIDQEDPSKYSFSTNKLYGDLNADGFTLGTTFTIEVIITDALNGGKSWTTVLNSGTPAIAISGSNVGIGAQYDTGLGGKLQVDGTTRINGQVVSTNYDVAFKHVHPTSGVSIRFGVGSGGTNRGIYDDTSNKWVFYNDGSKLTLGGDTHIDGTLGVNGAITRTLASSGTISNTNILSVTGSTDGLKLDYEASTADVGVARLYTTDDANARLELGNNVSGTYKRACWVENGKFRIDGFARNTTDTWIPVLNGGALDYAPRQIWSTQQHTNYNNNQDNLVTLSCLSYWNGAYNSSGNSNLSYAAKGKIPRMRSSAQIVYKRQSYSSSAWGNVNLVANSSKTVGSDFVISGNTIKVNNGNVNRVKVTLSISGARAGTGTDLYFNVIANGAQTDVYYKSFNSSYGYWASGGSMTFIADVKNGSTIYARGGTGAATTFEPLNTILVVEDISVW